MPLRVHVAGDHLDETYIAALRAHAGPEVLLSVGDRPSDWAQVESLVSGWPEEAMLDDGIALRSFVIPFAGPPARTLRMLRGRGLAVYNLHHNAAAVAEMALALVLACAKCIVPMDRDLRAGDWRARYGADPGLTLGGRRALVLGYGAIGRRVGALLGALGLEVTGVASTGRAGVRAVDDLDALLPAADVLAVALPATEATDGLIGAERLRLLPAQAIVVNVGRARVVDEGALYNALASGALHSAGMDVWYRYPRDASERGSTLPATQPFHELANVVMSPHRAGHGDAVERLRGEHLAAVLRDLARGLEPASRVNLAAGY
jgi:phosphoglycerate dehydrogenase-like enzyme